MLCYVKTHICFYLHPWTLSREGDFYFWQSNCWSRSCPWCECAPRGLINTTRCASIWLSQTERGTKLKAREIQAKPMAGRVYLSISPTSINENIQHLLVHSASNNFTLFRTMKQEANLGTKRN